MCDPDFRATLAARGYTLDDGEIERLLQRVMHEEDATP